MTVPTANKMGSGGTWGAVGITPTFNTKAAGRAANAQAKRLLGLDDTRAAVCNTAFANSRSRRSFSAGLPTLRPLVPVGRIHLQPERF